jgi:transmembrane sensor
MENKSHNSAQRALEEKALHWHVRLHGGDAAEADWLDFTSWLEADPAHNDAYDVVALAWDDAYDVTPAVETTASNENVQQQNNVVAFPMHRLRKAVSAKPWAFGGGFGAAIAATLMLLIAPVFMAQNDGIDPTLYATGVGEQRTITLADGSTVTLNTNTSISVIMDKTSRRIDLQKGEAYFDVSHEKARSFTVAANSLRVTDIGTRFDVRLDKERTLVSVTDGIVEVEPMAQGNGAAENKEPAVRLIEGQQAIHFSSSTEIKVQQFDPTQVTTWKQGYLVFKNDDLGMVVSELNRYFAMPLTLEKTDLASLHFSGILQISDQDRAVRDLTALLSLTADKTNTGIILRQNDEVHNQ